MKSCMPGLPVHYQLPESTQTMSIESVMASNHLILCRPLLLLLSIFPSIRVFWNDSTLLIRWPKYWSFHFNISPSNEYSRLISFMINWLDLLAVQGTLKSLLQHHSSKASVLQHSAFFFMIQLSHPYVTTGKTIALTIRTFVSKVMSLLFNMLSRSSNQVSKAQIPGIWKSGFFLPSLVSASCVQAASGTHAYLPTVGLRCGDAQLLL